MHSQLETIWNLKTTENCHKILGFSAGFFVFYKRGGPPKSVSLLRWPFRFRFKVDGWWQAGWTTCSRGFWLQLPGRVNDCGVLLKNLYNRKCLGVNFFFWSSMTHSPPIDQSKGNLPNAKSFGAQIENYFQKNAYSSFRYRLSFDFKAPFCCSADFWPFYFFKWRLNQISKHTHTCQRLSQASTPDFWLGCVSEFWRFRYMPPWYVGHFEMGFWLKLRREAASQPEIAEIP